LFVVVVVVVVCVWGGDTPTILDISNCKLSHLDDTSNGLKQIKPTDFFLAYQVLNSLQLHECADTAVCCAGQHGRLSPITASILYSSLTV
jgi:hypothetical protein